MRRFRKKPDGSKIVFVVEDGKAVQRSIEVGIEKEQRVQVVKGIKPGDQVVVTGSDKLKDGTPVRIANSEGKSRQAKSDSGQDTSSRQDGKGDKQ